MNDNTERMQSDDEIVEQEEARTEALEYADGDALEDAPTMGGDDLPDDANGNGGAMGAGPLP
jgi:hypothetical protein